MITYAYIAAGTASYYRAPGYHASAHTCAMYLVPKGAIVRIINADNRRESWCKVTDYGPDAARFPGRIIDVMPIVAKELGFYAIGTAQVRVYRERVTRETTPAHRARGVFCVCTPAADPLACTCTARR